MEDKMLCVIVLWEYIFYVVVYFWTLSYRHSLPGWRCGKSIQICQECVIIGHGRSFCSFFSLSILFCCNCTYQPVSSQDIWFFDVDLHCMLMGAPFAARLKFAPRLLLHHFCILFTFPFSGVLDEKMPKKSRTVKVGLWKWQLKIGTLEVGIYYWQDIAERCQLQHTSIYVSPFILKTYVFWQTDRDHCQLKQIRGTCLVFMEIMCVLYGCSVHFWLPQ